MLFFIRVVGACCLIGIVVLPAFGQYEARPDSVLPSVAVAGAGLGDEAVLAVIGDRPITYGRFMASYVQYLIRTGKNDTEKHRLQHFQQLRDAYLMADEARARGLHQDPGFDIYSERELKQAVGTRFFSTQFLDTLALPTERDLRRAFELGQQQVAVRHLVAPTREAADALRQRLEDGEDFVDLANEVYASARYDSAAGHLGYIKYWEMDDAFAEAAFSLETGVVSAPVRSRYGWHLLRVEDRLLSPLLSESEYQYRKRGLRSQVEQRRRKIEGDRFINELIDAADVETNDEAVRGVRDVFRAVLTDGSETPVELSDEEVEAVRERLRPDLVVATFVFDGVRRDFTLGDYLQWLPALSQKEARARTGASVGRALRNELLALHGFEKGLEADSGVQERLRHRQAVYLAGALSRVLRAEPAVPTEKEVAEAYERLGYNRLETQHADYWVIPFEDEASLLGAMAYLEAHPDSASAYPGYVRYDDADLLDHETPLRLIARQTPVGGVYRFASDDVDYGLVRVLDRREDWLTLEEARPEFEDRLALLLPQMRLLDELNAQAQIVTYDENLQQALQIEENLP